MTSSTRPGLAIYSQEWLKEVAPHIAEPLRPVVLRICESYQLGDSRDPELVAQMIEEELTNQLGCKQWHRIKTAGYYGEGPAPRWEQPIAIQFDCEEGWHYVSPNTIYKPEEITERTETP